jgi:hypothetical protein
MLKHPDASERHKTDTKKPARQLCSAGFLYLQGQKALQEI